MKLKYKFNLLLLSQLLVLTVFIAGFVTLIMLKALKAEMRDKELAITEQTAEVLANPLLNRDIIRVRNIIKNLTYRNSDIRYVYVVGFDGDVVMHTFPSGFPIELITANPIPSGQNSAFQMLSMDKESVQDLGVRVIEGMDAKVYIGFRTQRLVESVKNVSVSIIGIAALTLLCGMCVGLFMARRITGPIAGLVEGTKRVINGDLDFQIEVKDRDEIGILTKSFNRMTAERRRTEESLRNLSVRQEAILAAVPDIIMEVDVDKVYTWANKAGFEFFGKDVIGKEAVYYFEGEQDTYQVVAPLFSGDEDIFYVESWQRRLDGVPRLLAWWRRAIKNEEGVATGVISTARDITESKKAEEELEAHRGHLEEMVNAKTKDLMDSRQALVSLVEDINETNDQLTQANTKLQDLDRLKSMFIASMSHELRTPLNSIIGFTGIILMGLTGEITEEQRKQLSIVKSSGSHLLALINDVIDVSKIEAGKIDLFIDEFDLCAVLQEVKDSFAIQAEQKGLHISLSMPEKLIIKTDERRVKQIIMNLVSNAVKFTDKGRAVHISARAISEYSIADFGVRNAESKEKEKSEIRNPKSEITVSDTGIGIKEEDMDRLFKAFSRIPTEGALQEGTGLGLYLSQKIANLLGGEIKVESEFGKGSAFTLSLPRSV